MGVLRSGKVGSSLLGWVSLLCFLEPCTLYLQCKLLGGTSESTSTIVVVGSVSIDLLAHIERKVEETNSRTLDGLDSFLLHLLRPFNGDGDFLDVVELFDRSEQVERPALDATLLVLLVETALEVGCQVS